MPQTTAFQRNGILFFVKTAKDAGNFEGEQAAVVMIEEYGLRFVENPELLKI